MANSQHKMCLICFTLSLRVQHFLFLSNFESEFCLNRINLARFGGEYDCGTILVTKGVYTPFCNSNHTEVCCIKVLFHGTIRNNEFSGNTALQCWNNAATIRNNVATMSQRCVKNRRCESVVVYYNTFNLFQYTLS